MGKYEMLTFVTSVPSAQIGKQTAGDRKTWKENFNQKISKKFPKFDDDVNRV